MRLTFVARAVLVFPRFFHNYYKGGTVMLMKMRRACASLLIALAAAVPLDSSAAPYSGKPINLPATIEAEHFDKGGEGVGYHDTTAANLGGKFRTREGVDIIASRDPAGGGYVVGYFMTGEWLAYTVNVPKAGWYDISIRAANNDPAAGSFHVEVDGVNVTGSVSVPVTGSWSAFQWFGTNGVQLPAGKHVLKLVVDVEGFDVNQISVTATPVAVSGYTGTPYGGTPIALPRVFEAEDFDKGGQGVAYNDATAGNMGGLYRTGESVDIIASKDAAGGGYVVGYFTAGEWLAYTVNVPTSGFYDISIRAANNDLAAGSFHVEVDGVNVTGSVTVPVTGSWSAFQWFGKQGVQLGAGKRVLKLVADVVGFDVNQISVLAAAASPTPAPGGTIEPPAIGGKGYQLVKDWDFVSKIRTTSALQAEFYPFYVYSNGTLNWLTGNNEWQRYRDFTNGNHVFRAEGLALRAFLKSGQPLAAGNIDSGMLRSRWIGQYGYYEVKMKVPPGLGLWPAFWLNPQDQKWPPEIDVVEIVNNGRDTTRNSFHMVHGVGRQDPTYSLLDQWGSYRPPFDYKDDFHTFAVEWTPDRVRHFVDDKLVVDRPYKWLHNDYTDGGPAHVLLNLAVGGNWPGAPSASTLPAELVVKHIRVWQK